MLHCEVRKDAYWRGSTWMLYAWSGSRMCSGCSTSLMVDCPTSATPVSRGLTRARTSLQPGLVSQAAQQEAGGSGPPLCARCARSCS